MAILSRGVCVCVCGAHARTSARGSKKWRMGMKPGFGKLWFLLLEKRPNEQAVLLFRDLQRFQSGDTQTQRGHWVRWEHATAWWTPSGEGASGEQEELN